MLKKITPVVLLSLFFSAQVFSQCAVNNLTGNQVISTNTTWNAGTYNISGDFTINAGVTLTVNYSGNCPLTINANNINILGTINANGAGGAGGSGGSAGASSGGAGGGSEAGGGGGGAAGSGTGGGTAGNGGSAATGGCSISCGTICVGGNDADRAGAGGGAGGAGGSFGAAGGAGGAGAQGRLELEPSNSRCNSTPVPGNGGTGNNAPAGYGNSANATDLVTGSGGGGGGGGGGGFTAGTVGGTGGSGGGTVNLNASGNLVMSGTITANGNSGGNGGNGGVRSGNAANWNCENCGNTNGGGASDCRNASDCGACTYYTWGWPGGAGAGAGGGSGGGIKLQATGGMNITGVLQANGGNGGNSGHPTAADASCNNYAAGGAAGGGGVIKYVYDPCANNVFTPSQIQATAGTPGLGTDGVASTNTGLAGVILNQQSNIYVPGFTPFTALTAYPNQVICGLGHTPANALNTYAVSGGGGTYQYQWFYSNTNATGQTGAVATPATGWSAVSGGTASSLPAATMGVVNSTTYYQLQILSGPCATWSNVVTVLVDSIPTIASVTVGNVLCNGGSTGTITVNATGGDPGYTYSSDGGLLYFNALTNLAQGSYNVYVKDTNNCSSAYASNPVTINQPPVLNFTDVVTNANCAGLSNGAVTISPTGGVSPYQYAINAGSNQQANTFSGLAAGNYLVLVTDANSCPDTATIAVGNAYVFTLSIDSQTNATCYGDSNATVTLAASGGIHPYSYSLTGTTQASGYFTGLPQGYYVATATDSAGCPSQVNVQVSQAAQMLVQIDALVNIPCNNSAKGQVYVSPVGGSPTYAYLWSTGDTTQSDTSLVIGTYSVTITDAHACSASTTINITYDAAPSTTVTSADVTGCFGNTNGSAAVTATGGTAPLLYQWSNGATSTAITNIAGGTYIVTVSDLNYCNSIDTIVVNQPAQILANLDTIAPSCNGLSNGLAGVGPSGGTPGFTVAWSTGSGADTIVNLAAGNYSVTITDANNCVTSLSFALNQPAALNSSLVSVNDSCYGSPNGSAEFTGTGGTLPYTYAWSNGSTTGSVNNLTAGTYTVTLTDARQCSSTGSATITQPAQLQATTTSTNATGGQYNGSASISNIAGGVSPYNVRWSNGQVSNTISNLAGGSYIVVVTDANGCQLSDTVVVNAITGINMVDGDVSFSVYPNPGKTAFTVEMAQLNKETTLTMKDVLGQTIFNKTVVSLKTIIDLTNFAEGVYLIELSQGDNKTIKQVVVAK